jgi:hypothetical protein
MQTFLSISQLAGTTLQLVNQLSSIAERGLDVEEMGNTFLEIVGNRIALFTMPLAQFKSFSHLIDPAESFARITSGDEGWAAPMAQVLANIPFIGAAVIPETYSQLSGKPLDAFMPELRAGVGLTLRQWDRVRGEVIATGLPGTSTFIRSTHDHELDTLIASRYAAVIGQYADVAIFQNEAYLALDSPATRRDYLQRVVFPRFKKIAMGQVLAQVGWARLQEVQENPEQRRRRLRWERVNALAAEEGISFAPEEEPDAAAPDEPEPPEGPPLAEGPTAAPTSPFAGLLQPAPPSPF